MNKQLLSNLRQMSEAELYSALYKDSLTGAYNRPAFDQADYDAVAIVDMDSLKYLNDTFGHRVGDSYLVKLVDALRTVFGDDNVYRLGGDEFGVVGSDSMSLRAGFTKALRQFPGFSYGVGITIAEADNSLNVQKKQREACGQRASRGMCPPWEVEIISA